MISCIRIYASCTRTVTGSRISGAPARLVSWRVTRQRQGNHQQHSDRHPTHTHTLSHTRCPGPARWHDGLRGPGLGATLCVSRQALAQGTRTQGCLVPEQKGSRLQSRGQRGPSNDPCKWRETDLPVAYTEPSSRVSNGSLLIFRHHWHGFTSTQTFF